MNEIEELVEICNKGHKNMSGAAKFWVIVAIVINVVLPVLIVILVLAALIFWR
jgi:hypothetical protein